MDATEALLAAISDERTRTTREMVQVWDAIMEIRAVQRALCETAGIGVPQYQVMGPLADPRFPVRSPDISAILPEWDP